MKHPETACVLFAGRLFDFHVLDMIELGIEKFSSLRDIKVLWVSSQFVSAWPGLQFSTLLIIQVH